MMRARDEDGGRRSERGREGGREREHRRSTGVIGDVCLSSFPSPASRIRRDRVVCPVGARGFLCQTARVSPPPPVGAAGTGFPSATPTPTSAPGRAAPLRPTFGGSPRVPAELPFLYRSRIDKTLSSRTFRISLAHRSSPALPSPPPVP